MCIMLIRLAFAGISTLLLVLGIDAIASAQSPVWSMPSPDKPDPHISATDLTRLRPVVLQDLKEVFVNVYNIRTPTEKDLTDEFKQCRFKLLHLGTLGPAILVEDEGIGGRNVPMLDIYVPAHESYRKIVSGSGFGPMILPGTKAIPDLVFGGSEGACYSTLVRYHYNGKEYLADACDQEYRDESFPRGACPVRACERLRGKQLPTFPNPLRSSEERYAR